MKLMEAGEKQAEISLLNQASPWIQRIALLGIPSAGSVALVLLLQLPRSLYGQANPFLFTAEVDGLIAATFLVLLLRACLALPTAPGGFYRNSLDFLAMARWHPAAKAALIGLVVLPPAWYLRTSHYWLVTLCRSMGWRALNSGDVQSQMESVVAVYQLALTGGVPLLFALHMLSRWKPKYRLLPWVLVPVLFVGAAAGVVLLVALAH